MTRPLTSFKALTFDCYGTLIDWEGGIWDALQPLLAANGPADVSRTDALSAFARVEQRQQADTPALRYPEILRLVHGQLARNFGLESSAALDAAFGASVRMWPAFADTATALRQLSKHYRLVILSNVDRNGFAASARKLGVPFDAVYTAEDVGSYKPARGNFEYMLHHLRDDLGLSRADILHTAQSLHHDHVRAVEFGLATAWIDRQGLAEGGEWGATAPVPNRPRTDFIFAGMAEMADAVERERAAGAPTA